MIFLLTKVHRKIICAYIRQHCMLQMMFHFYAPCTIKCTMLFMKGSHGADHWGEVSFLFCNMFRCKFILLHQKNNNNNQCNTNIEHEFHGHQKMDKLVPILKHTLVLKHIWMLHYVQLRSNIRRKCLILIIIQDIFILTLTSDDS